MRYPKEQFSILVEALKHLSNYIDIKTVNPVAMYYIVFQQYSESQKHNHLYCFNGELKKYHKLTELEKLDFVKFINTNGKDFPLYPIGCDDSHIETAVKKALIELGIK